MPTSMEDQAEDLRLASRQYQVSRAEILHRSSYQAKVTCPLNQCRPFSEE
jgi:hypothetical protein